MHCMLMSCFQRYVRYLSCLVTIGLYAYSEFDLIVVIRMHGLAETKDSLHTDKTRNFCFKRRPDVVISID
jgi:hypothetical protein